MKTKAQYAACLLLRHNAALLTYNYVIIKHRSRLENQKKKVHYNPNTHIEEVNKTTKTFLRTQLKYFN